MRTWIVACASDESSPKARDALREARIHVRMRTWIVACESDESSPTRGSRRVDGSVTQSAGTPRELGSMYVCIMNLGGRYGGDFIRSGETGRSLDPSNRAGDALAEARIHVRTNTDLWAWEDETGRQSQLGPVNPSGRRPRERVSCTYTNMDLGRDSRPSQLWTRQPERVTPCGSALSCTYTYME